MCDSKRSGNRNPYSFYLSGRAWDKETEYSPRKARYHSHTKIKNLPLRLKQHFLYLFD